MLRTLGDLMAELPEDERAAVRKRTAEMREEMARYRREHGADPDGVSLEGVCVVARGENGNLVIESGLDDEQAVQRAMRIAEKGRAYVVVQADDLNAIIASGLNLVSE